MKLVAHPARGPVRMAPAVGLLSATFLLGIGLAAVATEDPSRIALGVPGATLILPAGFRPKQGTTDLVLHLHGGPESVERALATSGWNIPAVAFNRAGLSSVYETPFRSDPALLDRLITEGLAAIGRAAESEPPTLRRLVVSSFSAGFGGVRALLAQPSAFDRIDALVLADSLYCGYQNEDPATHRLDAAKMAGFRRFAVDAGGGRKSFLVTHSAQVPEGYASTTETASDLVREAGGRFEKTDTDLGDGWHLSRHFERGRLRVLGFDGTGAEDHLRHLRRLGELWKRLPGFP